MTMLDPEISFLQERLAKAACPEDLFGEISGSKQERAKTLKQRFSVPCMACHPDRMSAVSETVKAQANEAYVALQRFYKEAQARLKDGTYGKRLPMPKQEGALPRIRTTAHEYFVERRVAEGEIADLYAAFYQENGKRIPVILKICRESVDHALLENEACALERMKNSAIPTLLERFKMEDGRSALVLEHALGLDFLALREKFPSGVTYDHAGWIFERLLTGLGYAHKAIILHGAIGPEHLMVYPQTHRCFLVDFTFCVIDPLKTGATLKGTIPKYAAPEVLARSKTLTPAADLYALAKSMIFLMGGDPDAGTIPASVPNQIQRFVTAFLKPDPSDRPQDAWHAKRELHEIRERLNGGKLNFVEFKVSQ